MKTSKRIISALLTFVLIFSCSAAIALTADALEGGEASATEKFLTDIGTTGEMHIEGTLKDFQIGVTKLTVPFTVDAKGDTVSVKTKLSIFNVRILYLNGKCYVMLPAVRLYADYDLGAALSTTIENVLSRIWSEYKYFAQDFAVSAGESAGVIDGISYSRETIVENTQNPSFSATVLYADADKSIRAVAGRWNSTEFNVEITAISNDADDSMLSFPIFYFNITPLVLLIFSLLIS